MYTPGSISIPPFLCEGMERGSYLGKTLDEALVIKG